MGLEGGKKRQRLQRRPELTVFKGTEQQEYGMGGRAARIVLLLFGALVMSSEGRVWGREGSKEQYVVLLSPYVKHGAYSTTPAACSTVERQPDISDPYK